MIVLVGAGVGLVFGLFSLAMMRMGAFHLYALPGSPEHLTGLSLVLPMTDDLQAGGIAMIAGGWLLCSYVGAYLAGTIARTAAAVTLVQLVMAVLVLALATQGAAPWWLAGSGVLLAWLGGRLGENALCRATRTRCRALAETEPVLPQPAHRTAAPVRRAAVAVAPLPGFGRPMARHG